MKGAEREKERKVNERKETEKCEEKEGEKKKVKKNEEREQIEIWVGGKVKRTKERKSKKKE